MPSYCENSIAINWSIEVLVKFFLAIFLSAAFHAGLMMAPYLGTSHDALQPFIAASIPSRSLQVQILSANGNTKTESAAGTQAGKGDESQQTRTFGNDLLPFDGPAYFRAAELTRPPEPTVPVALDSPDLGVLPQSGVAILRLWIDDQGMVVDTKVEKSDVPEAFIKHAVNVFKKTRFVPGERNGRRVGTVMRIEVRYDDFSDGAQKVAQ